MVNLLSGIAAYALQQPKKTSFNLQQKMDLTLALERGLKVDHATINRWVICYSPQLEEVFRKRYKRPVGISWRMDEIYIKVKDQWVYLYRAVDKEGQTIGLCCQKNEMSQLHGHLVTELLANVG